MTWVVSDTFLLRRAGFRFGLLDRFAPSESPDTAAQWARAQEEAEGLRAAMLAEHFGDAVQRARKRGDRAALRGLSTLRRRVGARRALEVPPTVDDVELLCKYRAWAEATERAGRLAGEVTAAAPAVWRRAAGEMRAVATREDVADALFQLSPDFHEATARYGPDGRFDGAAARAHDRRLYSYLQRLAVKNETTSFFGPVTFGSFAPVDVASAGPELPGGVRERVGFVSFWAAAAIGRAATRKAAVRDMVPARRLPAVRVDGGAATLPGRAPVPLTEPQRRVLAVCDGTRDATAVAEATGLSPGDAKAELRALEQAALIQRRCEPCSTTFDPMEDVLRQLPDTPELATFRADARRFTQLAAEFSAAGSAARLPGGDADTGGTGEGVGPAPTAAASAGRRRERVLRRAESVFESLTGTSARRKAGGTYADRLVMFEDCHGDGQPLTVPDRWRRLIETDLAPVLDFGLAIGQRVRTAYRALAADILAAEGELEFLDFIALMATAVGKGRLTPHLAPADRLRTAYRDLVRRELAAGGEDSGAVGLTGSQLSALTPPVEGTAFVSPDLLLCGGGPDDGPIVLGELHPYVFGWGLQGGFAAEPDALARELEALLPVWKGGGRLATVLHRRRHKGLLSNRFPGTFIEVTGSAHTARRRVPIAGLRTVLREGEPVLLGPEGPLELYVGEEDHPHLRVFAPAQVELPTTVLGERSPRIVVGDVVVQRARWELAPEERRQLAEAEPERLPLVVAALRRRLSVPRHLFAASPSETKPVFVDLDSVFSQHTLRRLAGLDRLSLVEMAPGPDDLWLRRSTGAFTSELRLSMTRVPVSGAAGGNA